MFYQGFLFNLKFVFFPLAIKKVTIFVFTNKTKQGYGIRHVST